MRIVSDGILKKSAWKEDFGSLAEIFLGVFLKESIKVMRNRNFVRQKDVEAKSLDLGILTLSPTL